MSRRIEVPFPVPREAAFDFLVDPHNRMQWQSGLRAVEDVAPMPPQVGTQWRGRATGGIVSTLRLDAVERPTMWSESGTTRGLSMRLSLWFEEHPGGCLVAAETQFSGTGAWRPVAGIVSRVFPRSARRALQRAALQLGN